MNGAQGCRVTGRLEYINIAHRTGYQVSRNHYEALLLGILLFSSTNNSAKSSALISCRQNHV